MRNAILTYHLVMLVTWQGDWFVDLCRDVLPFVVLTIVTQYSTYYRNTFAATKVMTD